MYCQHHNAWNCGQQRCFGFYQRQGYSHPGMVGLDVNLSTGTLDVVEDLGGGIGIDLSTGDLVAETPFGDIDLGF